MEKGVRKGGWAYGRHLERTKESGKRGERKNCRIEGAACGKEERRR
ncbi:MAG: hypothetical protein A4E50_01951 [Methanosaeta sp. PtaB.Bin087]|jgi:hypothetical protein|nr:MAG: hypothetical protein A4E50_01951 [Methanosaeta sp. PtaB.Bin087]HNR58140.1 hypothetical protein [Methanothrix sp.]HNT71445.1 hypothetical protein [Methanothrix sp.]HOI70281.1 hypothetical protein [Methanothrix sp.]